MVYADFLQSTGYGTLLGLGGVNCRHSFNFVSEHQPPNYSPEQLQALHEQAQATKPYTYRDRKGNEVTKNLTQYEFSQKQRQMENAMRITRAKANAYKEAGAMDLYKDEKTRYYKQLDEYKSLSEQTELPEQRQRIYADGLGRT